MVEAQAAARIDRLDQDKDIVIYHYVVKQSIEEVENNTLIPMSWSNNINISNSKSYVAKERKSFLLSSHCLKIKEATFRVPRALRYDTKCNEMSKLHLLIL